MAGALLFAGAIAAQKVELQPVSQEVIETRLRAFTPKNSDREPVLRRLFEEAGCNGDALTEEPVNGLRAPNLVCTHAGATDSIIVVGAHFDLVAMGQGVIDNWSGASLLTSLYQGLFASESQDHRKHTFLFVGFTGEEKGLLGSQWFVKHLGSRHVIAMINFDTLGLSETKVWLSHADPDLAHWLHAVAVTMKLPADAVDVEKVGSSDSEPFRQKNIPSLTIHSITQQTLRILHSPADRLEAIHLDAYYRTYQLALGYLAFLDQKLD